MSSTPSRSAQVAADLGFQYLLDHCLDHLLELSASFSTMSFIVPEDRALLESLRHPFRNSLAKYSFYKIRLYSTRTGRYNKCSGRYGLWVGKGDSWNRAHRFSKRLNS